MQVLRARCTVRFLHLIMTDDPNIQRGFSYKSRQHKGFSKPNKLSLILAIEQKQERMSIEIARPQVEIDAAIRSLLQVQEEKLTIVHCRFKVEGGAMYRIWPQTFLIEDGGNRRKLIQAFNISLMPHWTIYFNDLGTVRFLHPGGTKE